MICLVVLFLNFLMSGVFGISFISNVEHFCWAAAFEFMFEVAIFKTFDTERREIVIDWGRKK